MPGVRGGEALTWERFQVTQDTLWENRRLTLGLSGCTASGPPKHSRYPRTSVLPGDTFWLRALHKCSSLGSGTGVLQPCCKDGDFRSLNPEQMKPEIAAEKITLEPVPSFQSRSHEPSQLSPAALPCSCLMPWDSRSLSPASVSLQSWVWLPKAGLPKLS